MKFQLHISGHHGMLLYFYHDIHPRYSDSDTLVFSPASFDNIAQQQQLCAVVLWCGCREEIVLEA